MDKDADTVSIIIPLYNRDKLIIATLESIAKQTYPHWEAIVIDDGSTDKSYEVVEHLGMKDSRIKLQKRNREPKGAATCRNIGIDNASGKYVIFLDSDDLLAPFCLEQRINKISKLPDFDFAVFNMLLFNEKPGDLDIIWNIVTKEDDLTRFLKIDGVWSITGPIYRRSAFLEKLKGFDESLPFWQDFELHIRALICGIPYVKFLDQKPDCYNRRHEFDSISQKGLHTEEKLTKKSAIYRKIVGTAASQNKLNRRSRKVVVSVLLNFSRQFIIHHNNLQAAISNWSYAYEKKLINKPYFLIGKLYLKYLYQHKRQNKSVSIALFLSKFFSLPLKRYHKKENTMCKINMQHAYS